MLTPIQSEALVWIDRFTRSKGHCPTFSEIASGIGLKSKSQVSYVVKRLIERGFLTQLPHQAQSLAVLKLPEGMAPAPESLWYRCQRLADEIDALTVDHGPELGPAFAGRPLVLPFAAGLLRDAAAWLNRIDGGPACHPK